MKTIQLFIPIILSLCTFSCAGKDHNKAGKGEPAVISNSVTATVDDTFDVGKIISHVYCKNDALQSYALYIPLKGKAESLPVMYFFDPHGNGSFPLTKYKSLAERYGFILIGSNNSKNGNDLESAEKIWNILVADTKARLKINNERIYTCGFSGGGKVACYIALQHSEVKGVIANSGALPEVSRTGNFHFSFVAIAGEGDMNMTELVSISNELEKTQTRHRIIFFNGNHEWAPEQTMDIAFTALQIDAMHDHLMPSDQHLVESFILKTRKKIDVYLKEGNYLKAESEYKFLASLPDIDTSPEAKNIKEQVAAIKSNPGYAKQLRSKQDLLAREENWKNEFNEKFGTGDASYWQKTINDFRQQARKQTDEGSMYQRLLAYLSLAFYSISNQLITTDRNQDTQHFVDLYKMVDPANSEAWYFSAVLNARNNNVKAVENDLFKAMSIGFADKDRMRRQPEFQKVKLNFPAIESKMQTK